MAFVGLRYAVFAPIESETAGQPVTYGAGAVIGKMIGADITYNRNSEALYADDAQIDSDNAMTGGTVSLNLDDIDDEKQVLALGLVKSGEGEETVYSETGDPSPYGGLGYIRERRLLGKTTYVAYWIHKVQLAIASESASTKTNRVSWQTPTLTGPIMAVVNSTDMKNHFRDHATFDDVAKAVAWVNKRANIAEAAAQTTGGETV